MHDRTKRFLCRGGFLAFCVLPTATVWAWTSSWQGASHRAAVAAQLSQSLGLKTTLTDVAYPKPGLTLLEGLQLADPETGLPLVQTRFVEGAGENSLALVASQPEIDAAQLARLWRAVDARLRESVDGQPNVRLAASEVTLHLPEGSQTLTEFLAQLDTRSSTTERAATISFRLAGTTAGDPIRIRYARQVATDAPPTAHRPLPAGARVATQIELHTGGEAIPAWLLAGPIGVAHHLGSHARFRGSIWATETADGWEGELSGRLLDVDLQALVGEQFPHRLSGPADITIQNARIHRGRLEEASGSITAGPGVVGRSLLAAAAENLHWTAGDAAAKIATLQQYEQLALGFTIDAAGLTVRGQCNGAPGAIFTSRDGVLMSESAAAVPVVALLRTLVPQSEVQAPATPESSWLIGRLPLPEIMPPANKFPEGHLRGPMDQ